jgi:type VI protein secretion system component Hcp
MIIIAMSGCGSSTPTKPIINKESCSKHEQLPKNIDKDIDNISPELFSYIELNETVYTCDCLTEEKQECQESFLRLKERYTK